MNLQFLQDSDGRFSSKRVGFLITLITSIFAGLILLAVLIYNRNFGLALDLVDTFLFSSYVFGGLVTTDVFVKIFKK